MPSVMGLIVLVGIKQICGFFLEITEEETICAGNFPLLPVLIGYVFAHFDEHVSQQCPLLCSSVPGQPSKFQFGSVSDTSIELTWDLAYEKEGIVNYELRYRDSAGSQARILALPFFKNPAVFGFKGRACLSPTFDLFAVVSRQIS